MALKDGPDHALVAIEKKLDVRTALERNAAAGTTIVGP